MVHMLTEALGYKRSQIKVRMNCADTTAALADEEVKTLLSDCYEAAKTILAEHRELLDDVALYLLQKETITGDELMAYVKSYDHRLKAGEPTETLDEESEA